MLKRKNIARTIFLVGILMMSSYMIGNSFLTSTRAVTTNVIADLDTYGYQVGDVIEYMHPSMDNSDNNGNSVDQDWLEQNDYYYGARFLDIPGYYHDLITEDPDFYQVYLNTGDYLQVDLWCQNGADIQLTWMNSENNPGYSDDEESTPDGHCYLDYTASSPGNYVFLVESHGYYRDNYDLEIRLNGNTGPDHWPDNNSNGDGNKSGFEVLTITNIYDNSSTGQVVMEANISMYEDPGHNNLIDFQPNQIVAQVIPDNISTVIGSRFFPKNLSCDDPDLISALTDMAQAPQNDHGFGIVSNFHVTSTHDMIVMTGLDNESMQVLFRIQKLPGDLYGGLQYMEISKYNETSDQKYYQEFYFYLNGPGIANVNTPKITVKVGDSWTYILESHEQGHEWGTDYNNNWDHDMLAYETLTVTHIVALFNNTVGVFGNQQMLDTQMNEQENRIFTPFLIMDTTHPLSFVNMAGYGQMEGPPVLVPAGIDWTTQESELINLIMQNVEGPMPPVKTASTPNIIRFHYNINQTDHQEEQTVMMEVEGHGILSTMSMSQNRKESYSDGGSERQDNSQMYLLEAHLNNVQYSPTVIPANVVPLNINDEFIWEMSRYSNDPNNNRTPDQKDQEKMKVKTFIPTLDGHVVILGEMYHQNYDETSWVAELPTDDTGASSGPNLWIIGAPRDGDVWSIVGPKNYFAYSSLTDFNTEKPELLKILNFALTLPVGVTIEDSDLICNGRNFTVSISENSKTQNLLYALNEHGVLQDMLMGEQDSIGNWTNWERTVLISAPSGYSTGELFTSDIPSNYIPNTPTNTGTGTGSNTNPFGNIPGFSPIWIIGIACISIALILRRKRKYAP